ncbi:MAG: protein translocase subunit SecF [Candidatus Aenigmarchaeota archaeon]|nr:protein translocase subunit SecF [Candidatus Aenigmarchaeota archaeon]
MTEKFLDENYKLLLVVPIAVLLFSVGVLLNSYNQDGEMFLRSIELKGGTSITINTNNRLDIDMIELSLKEKFTPIKVREVRSLGSYGTIIETSSEADSEQILLELSKIGIDTTDNSIEFIGPSLGATFWIQAQLAIILALIFMGIIVFVIFRTFVPSLAVIMSALFDIVATLAFMQVFGIELSLAGLAAILMLIGYSVDTDIMLTTRLLKESDEKTLNAKMRRALKTGLTMTITSIGAMSALFLSSISPVLSQIAMVLLIGLVLDIMNTWLMNSVILKWYCEKRGLV